MPSKTADTIERTLNMFITKQRKILQILQFPHFDDLVNKWMTVVPIDLFRICDIQIHLEVPLLCVFQNQVKRILSMEAENQLIKIVQVSLIYHLVSLRVILQLILLAHIKQSMIRKQEICFKQLIEWSEQIIERCHIIYNKLYDFKCTL